MSQNKVVVIGGSFAGLTAALHLKHDLHDDVDVTVISNRENFEFNPSFIWVPFGKRDTEEITFPVAPVFESHEVNFVLGEVTQIDAANNQLETTKGGYDYDYLVVATGYRNNYDVIPGLGPDEHTHGITALGDALEARQGWEKFLDDPGPIVVGATQGAACFGAAYEFLFNVAHRVKKHDLQRQVKITYVTSEPFLGHFGIGGLPGGEKMLNMFLDKLEIEAIVNVAMEEVVPDELRLADGRTLPFKYAMIVPPFLGAEVVMQSEGLGDDKGFIPVKDTYQTYNYPNIYSAGIAAAVEAPWQSAVAVGVPKTGFPSETMAHVAADNIASQIKGEEPKEHKEFGDIRAMCIMDAGDNGVIILADKMLPPRKHGIMIPGPQSHLAKLAFEKYYLWKMKHGYVNLP